MPYILYQFDSLDVPGTGANYASHEITPGEAQSGLVSLPSGLMYDSLGSEWARSSAPTVRATGRLVAATAADLKTALDNWLAKRGKRATLTRKSDGGTVHSTTARLLSVRAPREPGFRLFVPVELTFELLSLPWDGTSHADSTVLNTSPKTVTVTNNGNARVTDPVITITAGSTAITVVTVAVSGVSSWTYTGTIASTKALVVDCGALSVKNDGANAYSGFALNAGHVVDDWIRLEPGNTSVVVTLTGGSTDSSIKFEFYDGWA